MRGHLGVGVDIVDVDQVKEMISRGGSVFLRLCWTPDELTRCRGSVPRLAARWAAKEAAMKALGRGIGEIAPTDIEVVGDNGHAPALRLSGSALAMAPPEDVDLVVTMSHGANLAIAFVVATPRVTSGACGDCRKDQCHGTR